VQAWWAGRSLPLLLALILAGFVALYVVVERPFSSPAISGAPSASAESTAARAASPTPAPVVLRGSGPAALQPFALPGPISVAHLTHDGQKSFIVQSFVGGQGDLLVNTVGPYDGSRPLFEGSPVQLTIQADGAWTVTVTVITCCAASGEFAGSGDAVSEQFNPPARGTWEFSNTGKRSYVVYAHCLSGDQIVQDRVGPFQGKAVVAMTRGPCYWEVISDGSWSIRPLL